LCKADTVGLYANNGEGFGHRNRMRNFGWTAACSTKPYAYARLDKPYWAYGYVLCDTCDDYNQM